MKTVTPELLRIAASMAYPTVSAFEAERFRAWLRAQVDAMEKPAVSAEPVAAHTWQHIETAPKDGRALLLGYLNPLGKWRTVRGEWMSQDYIDNYWEDSDGAELGWYEVSVESDAIPNCWLIDPTHWMPLPGEPTKANAAHPPTVDDAIERALTELVDKIVPGLDTGDLVADAATASTALCHAKRTADDAELLQILESRNVSLDEECARLENENDALRKVANDDGLRLTTGMDRSAFHSQAWSMWHSKALDDAKLPKLSIHAIRTLWDALYDSMPLVSRTTADDARDAALQSAAKAVENSATVWAGFSYQDAKTCVDAYLSAMQRTPEKGSK